MSDKQEQMPAKQENGVEKQAKLIYIDSIMETPSGSKPCFDICKQIDDSTIEYLCEVLDGGDARRLVACWNACKSLTTEELEKHGLGSSYGNALENSFKQRAALVEALKAIIPPEGSEGWWCPCCKNNVDATYHENCATCGTFIGYKQPGTKWIEKARAALRAGGGE